MIYSIQNNSPDNLVPFSTEATTLVDRPLIDLAHVARILWHRRLIIIMCIFVSIVCALSYIILTPSSYTSRAVLLVDPRETRFTDADEVLSGIGPDSAAIASQVEVLRSRELLTNVLRKENLFKDPEFAGSNKLEKNAVYEKFIKQLSVERQGLTYIIEVAFTSEDREKSARITNAIVAQYIKGQIGEKSRANSDVTGLLEGQIDGLRKSVSEAEATIETFMAEKGMLDIGSGRTLLQSQVEQINLHLLGARDRARRAASRFEQAKKLQPIENALIANSNILSSPAADTLRSQYNLNFATLAQLANIYGERHPRYISQLSQLDSLKTLMAAETNHIVRKIGGELQLANEDVAKVEAELATLRFQSENAGRSQIELRQLQLQASANRDVLQKFIRRSKETGQLNSLQRSEVRSISVAVPPTRAIWPRPTLMLGVAGFLGTIVGVTLALLMGVPVAITRTENSYDVSSQNQSEHQVSDCNQSIKKRTTIKKSLLCYIPDERQRRRNNSSYT